MSKRNQIKLFSNGRLSDHFHNVKQQAVGEINNLGSAYLASVEKTDVADNVFSKYELVCPKLEKNDIRFDAEDSQNLSLRHFNGQSIQEHGTLYSYFVPFTGDSKLLRMRPSSFSSQYPIASITEDRNLVFEYFRRYIGKAGKPDKEAQEIESQFEYDLRLVESFLSNMKKDTEQCNAKLKEQIIAQINYRIQKFKTDESVEKSMKYPMRQREGVPRTFEVPTRRRKLPRTKKNDASEELKPVLAIDDYEHILSVIKSMAMVMEYSPTAFSEMDEETLRWHFLVQLNGHYEGQATGETFNASGKTDIIIKVDGKNIFIAECKYWRGQKSFKETIDQLLGYTSWRDTKTAIVIFCRNKKFSQVLEQIPDLMSEHPNFLEAVTKKAETDFRYRFTHKDDSNRKLDVAVLLFHVPK